MHTYPPPADYQTWLETCLEAAGSNESMVGILDPLSLRMKWQLNIAGFMHTQAGSQDGLQIAWTSHALVCPPGVVGLKTSRIRYSEHQLGILTIATGGEFFDGESIVQAVRELQETQDLHLEVWQHPELLGLQINAQGSSMFYLIDWLKAPQEAARFITREEFFACYRHILLHLHNGHPFGNGPETADPHGYEIVNPLRQQRDKVPTIAHGIALVSELLQACPPHLLSALQNNPIKIKAKKDQQVVWTSQQIMPLPEAS
jgi:hypothetical protein